MFSLLTVEYKYLYTAANKNKIYSFNFIKNFLYRVTKVTKRSLEQRVFYQLSLMVTVHEQVWVTAVVPKSLSKMDQF